MKRLALAAAPALILALAATAASARVPMSTVCSDGYSWVSMVYAQPVGSSCAVLMWDGWIYYGWTI